MYNLGISDLILLTYLLTSHLTRKHNLVPCFYISADYKLPPRSIDVFDLTSSSSTGPRSHDTQPSRVHKTRRHRFCGHFEHTDLHLSRGWRSPSKNKRRRLAAVPTGERAGNQGALSLASVALSRFPMLAPFSSPAKRKGLRVGTPIPRSDEISLG